MTTFDQAFTRLMGHEGAYSNHAADPGVLLTFASVLKSLSNLLYGLTSTHSQFNGVSRAAKSLSPTSDSFSYFVQRKVPSSSKVVGLLAWRSPSAIIRGVVTAVVNSVKRASFWPFSHVCDEIIKRIHPLRANRYAAATPKIKSSVPIIQASALHRSPRSVFRCVSHPMLANNIAKVFIMKTPARARLAASEFASAN